MKVLMAGGGTAGHINPGIAIAKYIMNKEPGTKIVFVGTEKGLETKLVPREGFELKLIKVRGFRRKLSKDTFVAVKELFQGFFEARKVLREFKPDLVIGTGGYVCGPVLFNAARMGVPTLIHEQNAFPGITNRILSRFVDVVAISFKESEKFFKSAKKLVLTGNPIRSEMLQIDRKTARKKLGIAEDIPFVVIFGGSRGAERINENVADMALNHFKNCDIKIMFATGDLQYEKINSLLKGKVGKSFEVVPYIYDMANTMGAADLAVCRAGAITISELTVLGVPSIMIPSPYVTANHQEHNARSLEKQGAAEVILESEINGKLLFQKIVELVQNTKRLKKMSEDAKKAGIRNALDKIYELTAEIKNESV